MGFDGLETLARQITRCLENREWDPSTTYSESSSEEALAVLVSQIDGFRNMLENVGLNRVLQSLHYRQLPGYTGFSSFTV